jgi:hypothetical protein
MEINTRTLYYHLFLGSKIDFSDTEMFEKQMDEIGYDIKKTKNN